MKPRALITGDECAPRGTTTTNVASEGLRARKRRETRDRIAAEALSLFRRHGYDGTTIEMIAEQTDVSPRTVFHYYSSKDKILEALAGGGEEAFRAALTSVNARGSLLDAVRAIMMEVIAGYEAETATAISRLLYSTERLLAFKQAAYHRKEQQLFQVLREARSPEDDELTLRLAAMTGIGALRASSELWVRDGRRQPLKTYLARAFDRLAAQAGRTGRSSERHDLADVGLAVAGGDPAVHG